MHLDPQLAPLQLSAQFSPAQFTAQLAPSQLNPHRSPTQLAPQKSSVQPAAHRAAAQLLLQLSPVHTDRLIGVACPEQFHANNCNRAKPICVMINTWPAWVMVLDWAFSTDVNDACLSKYVHTAAYVQVKSDDVTQPLLHSGTKRPPQHPSDILICR
jgi:hypothetical protein